MKKILILDNYDSFTYNLVQIVKTQKDVALEVFRNDEISLDEVTQYDAVILSPGPGVPEDAGIMKALIQRYASQKPMLGICLGHQAIAENFGAKLQNMNEVWHGIQDLLQLKQDSHPLFKKVSAEFEAGRYHSWTVKKDQIGDQLVVNCTDSNGEVMGIHHLNYPCYGLQFHPESILTPVGAQIVHNFLALVTAQQL